MRGKRVLLPPVLEREAVSGKHQPTECSPVRHEQKAVANAYASELKQSLLMFLQRAQPSFAADNYFVGAGRFCNFLRDKKLRKKDLK